LPWLNDSRPAPADLSNYPSSNCPEIFKEFARLDGYAIEGPFDEGSAEVVVISPIGGVIKTTATGTKVRAVIDMTASGVNAKLASPHVPLSSLDDVMRDMRRGDYLCKIDLADYFFHFRVHESERKYLGFRRPDDGKLYRFSRLPFGLRSSPWLACSLTRTAVDILKKRFAASVADGANFGVYDYVDDILLRCSTKEGCERLLAAARSVLGELGLIIAEHKTEGPAQCLTFLGLQIDSVQLSLTVDDQRLSEIKVCVQRFDSRYRRRRRSRAPRRELERLAGKLSFAARAVRSGRAHLRSLFDAAASVPRGRVANIPSSLWDDLDWWRHCIAEWNGVSFRSATGDPTFDLEMYTDASGYGYGASRHCVGAVASAGLPSERIAGVWTPAESQRSSNWRELRTIVLAARAWGAAWRGRRVRVSTDNSTSDAIIRSGTSTSPLLLGLLRELHHLEALHSFEMISRHVPGDDMIAQGTDGLSRGTVTPSTSDWRVTRTTYDEICQLVGGHHDVDAFASAGGGHLERAFFTEADSAFHRTWAGLNMWCNPQHALLGQALERALIQHGDAPQCTGATFLVPVWRTAHWWRLRRHFECIKEFPSRSHLFQKRAEPGGCRWLPPAPARWPHEVWRLSPTDSDAVARSKNLQHLPPRNRQA